MLAFQRDEVSMLIDQRRQQVSTHVGVTQKSWWSRGLCVPASEVWHLRLLVAGMTVAALGSARGNSDQLEVGQWPAH